MLQTFKHIFTSPSSVEREAKATRSGNARIHGMTSVTRASIAYAATQVFFMFICSFCFIVYQFKYRQDLLCVLQMFSTEMIL